MKRTKGSGHPHIIGASKTKTDLFTGLDITKGHADEVWHVNKTWKKKK